jgi:hypothetical protein
MEAEHCSMGGSEDRFKVGNSEKETWPANEWAITVGGEFERAHVGSSRKLKTIVELMRPDKPVVTQAKLTRPEVIAIVLYTGPMVSRKHF